MNFLATFIIFGLCLIGMAVGLILSNKSLRKGCSDDPDNCSCRAKGISPDDCEEK